MQTNAKNDDWTNVKAKVVKRKRHDLVKYRQRGIEITKSSAAYQNYIKLVPKHKRTMEMPTTPHPADDNWKRSVNAWRFQLDCMFGSSPINTETKGVEIHESLYSKSVPIEGSSYERI